MLVAAAIENAAPGSGYAERDLRDAVHDGGHDRGYGGDRHDERGAAALPEPTRYQQCTTPNLAPQTWR